MPTKRQFDMVVLTIILVHPVTSLFKMWSARKLAVDNTGPAATVIAGATRLVA